MNDRAPGCGPSGRRSACAAGFTLVETILVLVVLAIAAAGIASLSGNIFQSDAANRTLQLGTKLMQECAEHIIARKNVANTSLSSYVPSCADLYGANETAYLAQFGFSAFSVSLPAVPSGICPNGVTCKLVDISIVTTSNETLVPITLLLASS